MEERATSRQPKRPCPADDLPPTQASKRIRFTYGRRQPPPPAAPKPASAKTPPRPVRTLGAMNMGKSSPVSGQVDIPTPVWRKIREQPDTPLRAQASPERASEDILAELAPPYLLVELRLLRQAVPGQRYRIYEAVFGWWNGLLRSTMPEVGEAHRNSLLGMCMRRLPACVANIEEYERQVVRDQGRQSMWDASNVSFELYGQLEALGCSNSGWRPLKLAVRSHATSLLSEAVSEGLLDPSFVGLLTRLCLHLGCREEAARLAGSVEVALPAPRSMQSSLTESKLLLPLRCVLYASKGTSAPTAALDCVSTLVRKGLLPVSWLSTRTLAEVWALSLEAMAASTSGMSATAFMSTCLPLLSNRGRGKPATQAENTKQTLISVTAGAVAAVTTVSAAHDSIKEQRRKRTWRRVLYVLDLCLAEVRQQRRRRRRQDEAADGLFVLALARHLAAVNSPFADAAFKRQARSELEDLAQSAGSGATSQSYYRQAIGLLCCLAQFRSRSCAASGRDSLTELCAQLDDLDLGGCFGHGLRTDVAFLLAQKTKDLRDLAFAESLPSAEGTARVSTIFSGWRWEEGISEWVLPTSRDEDDGAGQASKEEQPRSRSTGPTARAYGRPQAAVAASSRRTRAGSDICDGKENKPDTASCGKSRPKAASRPVRLRPMAVNVLRRLPADDDWDDLM